MHDPDENPGRIPRAIRSSSFIVQTRGLMPSAHSALTHATRSSLIAAQWDLSTATFVAGHALPADQDPLCPPASTWRISGVSGGGRERVDGDGEQRDGVSSASADEFARGRVSHASSGPA